MSARKKTVYCARIRFEDSEPWGETTYYRKRKERDNDASITRIIGGARVWTFEETKTPEEIAELFDL